MSGYPPLRFLLAALLLALPSAFANNEETGVPISYQLPAVGTLPQTYLVTLAITAPDNPDWIVSTFIAGQPRTVTAKNQGRFTETWNGLDDNYMPVPPGNYGVKGIYAPAEFWDIDEEWHAITAKFTGGVSPWLPDPQDPEHWKKPLLFKGDPVNQPLADVDVGPNGVAVFYYKYLENGLNAPMFDLNKPLGYDQFVDSFKSGGAAGGFSVATDGETVWAAGEEGGPRFIYRTDQKPFGRDSGAYRKNVTITNGKVTGMDAWKNPTTGQSFVYVTERGKFNESVPTNRHHKYGKFTESDEEFINELTVYAGADGTKLATVDVPYPQGVVIHSNALYTLNQTDAGGPWAIGKIALQDGLPEGKWQQLFIIPNSIEPIDLELDSKGRIYLSDATANRIYQLDQTGNITRTFGNLPRQTPGSYDPETFMAPGKLATWRDADGRSRLIVVENAGPNRASEWDADTGEFIGDYPSYQTKANNGYAVDPADPNLIYLPTQGDWLTRFRVDYETGKWTVDAVWPEVKAGQHGDLDKPVAVRANNDTLYLAGGRKGMVYRLDE
ncbi:MAG: hypothetical protein ACQKBV_13495, partial [Puniceicoccales bacterium]